MSRVLAFRNRQRVRPVNLRRFRALATWALEELFESQDYELGVVLLSAADMAALNEKYLGHTGSTDVITFDHRDRPARRPLHSGPIRGEIFICLDDAIAQAREWKETWQAEIVRYFLHGLLHLRGYDDRAPGARRRMKREENRMMRLASSRFLTSWISRGGAKARR